MKRWLAIASFAAMLGGCATLELIEKSETAGPGYTVALPLNWVRLPADGDQIVITHDGFGLQRISIQRRVADKSFPKLKKNADEKLLASELAEMQIAELKLSGEQMATLTTVDNGPESIGSRPGFRIQVQFKTANGLLIEQVYCGVVHKGHYYLISYSAPSLYYFKKYQPAFEKVVATLRLL